MNKILFIGFLFVIWSESKILGPIKQRGDSFMAGVAKINATLPLGVPLAGYNHGARRVPIWPIPITREYTTFMEPSIGVLDPNWVKALVLDDGTERICFVTMDGIGADGNLADLAFLKAQQNGFSVKRENVIFSASHTHSGPGAITPEFLWAIAPATDLEVPSLVEMFTDFLMSAMVQAEKNLTIARMDIGIGELLGVTRNRRAPNPWVQVDTIDPRLGVIRVDDLQGNPIATVWNFAIHGTCYGPDNMKMSSDILGASCDAIEKKVGGVSLFINSDAGDIAPTDAACGCSNRVCNFTGADKISAAVTQIRQYLDPTSEVVITVNSQIIPFGPTSLNITLERFDNCTVGGPLDICTFCKALDCTANIHLGSSWVEQNPRFTAIRFDVSGKKIGMFTIPGEALLELGWWIRNDTQDLGFDETFLLGYSNNHMGYFATPNEYDWGGYESQLTFWGTQTAAQIREGCLTVAKAVSS